MSPILASLAESVFYRCGEKAVQKFVDITANWGLAMNVLTHVVDLMLQMEKEAGKEGASTVGLLAIWLLEFDLVVCGRCMAAALPTSLFWQS